MGASVVVWKTFALFTPVGVSTSVAQSIPAFWASSIVCSEAWESIAAWVVIWVCVERCVRGSDDFVGWIVVQYVQESLESGLVLQVVSHVSPPSFERAMSYDSSPPQTECLWNEIFVTLWDYTDGKRHVQNTQSLCTSLIRVQVWLGHLWILLEFWHMQCSQRAVGGRYWVWNCAIIQMAWLMGSSHWVQISSGI